MKYGVIAKANSKPRTSRIERMRCGLLLSQSILRCLFCMDRKLAAHHNGQVSMLLRFSAGEDMTGDTFASIVSVCSASGRKNRGGNAEAHGQEDMGLAGRGTCPQQM